MASRFILYQLPNTQSKWSWQYLKTTFKRRTQYILQNLWRRKEQSALLNRTQVKPYRDVTGCSCRGKQFDLKFYRPGNLHRTISRWQKNSLASLLKRKTAGNPFRSNVAIISFVGFTLSAGNSLLTEHEELEGLSFTLRDTFSKLSLDDVDTHDTSFPKPSDDGLTVSLDELEIDGLIAKGCNAAVYSARWKANGTRKEVVADPNKIIISHDDVHIEHVQPFRSLSIPREVMAIQKFLPFDLAVKLMFNYDAESTAISVWRSMGKETLPAIMEPAFLDGRSKTRKIPPHPNIVKMYCAFPDQMPLLQDALTWYPQALPQRLTHKGYGRNMTMCLVMKRYHCSLKDYLKEHQLDFETSLLLLCQILEGVVHLQQHGFAHRDLKSDNILLDLTCDSFAPLVTIADFGCCLEGIKLAYNSEEVDRGGNQALMAPEIATAVPGPFVYLDYSRSDLWTVGSLAYEIFGAPNPFYQLGESFLEAVSYSEKDLPLLPDSVPNVLQRLVRDILQKDPQKRPSPTFAATVCQLLLHAPAELLSESYSKQNCKRVVRWLFLLAAETFLRVGLHGIQSNTAKHQLCYSLFARVQCKEIFQALCYIQKSN